MTQHIILVEAMPSLTSLAICGKLVSMEPDSIIHQLAFSDLSHIGRTDPVLLVSNPFQSIDQYKMFDAETLQSIIITAERLLLSLINHQLRGQFDDIRFICLTDPTFALNLVDLCQNNHTKFSPFYAQYGYSFSKYNFATFKEPPHDLIFGKEQDSRSNPWSLAIHAFERKYNLSQKSLSNLSTEVFNGEKVLKKMDPKDLLHVCNYYFEQLSPVWIIIDAMVRQHTNLFGVGVYRATRYLDDNETIVLA